MTTPTLIPNGTSSGYGEMAHQVSETTHRADHAAKIQRSALWAAYGDALGWISELTDENGLLRRTGGTALCQPIAWTRRVGGRSGIMAKLPIGCYSDDTQLRLATGRAIRPDGFDVEAFAKVELPVWLSYALGGGKGTSSAASNLAKPRVPWYTNTFKGWTESGGNGAAMRIQPHVWAAPAPDDTKAFLPDVIRNAVCTHSHPTGVMGAVLHALALSQVMVTGRIPSPDDLDTAITDATNLPALMQNDFEVWNYWRTAFEREAGPFNAAWERAIADARDALRIASSNPSNLTGAERYSEIVDNLMLRERERIGNGILTAVAAVGLTWCETDPAEALRIASNSIRTDTDTIATMAGAIIGVTATTEPPVEVMDAGLIKSEATRLSAIAHGGRTASHRYPDLLHWSSPKTHSDALTCAEDGSLHVSGLGPAQAIGEPISSPKGDFKWQWLNLEIGQTLLIKRRDSLAQMDTPGKPPVNIISEDAPPVDGAKDTVLTETHLDLQAALGYIKEHIRDSEAIGKSLRRVVYLGTRGEIAAFTAALIDLIRDDRDNAVGSDERGANG